MNSTTFHGTAHGRVIELDAESGLPEGQPVRVTLEPATANGSVADADRLARLKRAAGGWANDDAADLDQYLVWNRQRRKSPRREIPE